MSDQWCLTTLFDCPVNNLTITIQSSTPPYLHDESVRLQDICAIMRVENYKHCKIHLYISHDMQRKISMQLFLRERELQ